MYTVSTVMCDMQFYSAEMFPSNETDTAATGKHDLVLQVIQYA